VSVDHKSVEVDTQGDAFFVAFARASNAVCEQDLAVLCRLLQPRGHVDDVTGREPLLGARDRLPAADADLALNAELGQRRLSWKPSPRHTHR
jgi:hypothetical protein